MESIRLQLHIKWECSTYLRLTVQFQKLKFMWRKQIIQTHRLKSALYTRLAKNDLDAEHRKTFEKIKNWLVFEYKG